MIYLCVVCAWTTHATVYVWRHGNSFQELILSIYANVGFGDGAQINGLGGESLYPLSHFASPTTLNSYLMS